ISATEFLLRRNLDHAAIGPLAAVQTPAATVDVTPLVRRQRPVRDVRAPTLHEDPAGLMLLEAAEVLRKESIDVLERRAGFRVVQGNHGILRLKNLLVEIGRAHV